MDNVKGGPNRKQAVFTAGLVATYTSGDPVNCGVDETRRPQRIAARPVHEGRMSRSGSLCLGDQGVGLYTSTQLCNHGYG